MRASQRLRALRSALAPRPAAAATPETLETPLARGLRLPVVDLRAADAAAQLVTACTEVGFQCVVGHGLDPAHGAAAVSELEGFFGAATPAELDAVRKPTEGYGPGLQKRGHLEGESYGTEHGTYATSLREDFVVVHPHAAARKAAGDPYYCRPAGQIWYGDCANRWPSTAMQAALERYYLSLEAISQRMLRLCGLAIAADEGKFADLGARHTTNLACAFHRACPSRGAAAEPRVSPHSDTALFTLIHYGTAGVGGLEVQDQASGEWLRVSHEDLPPNALVFNCGDTLRLLSNGRFLSTPHRVVDDAPPGQMMPDRLALCYFFAPSYDAEIRPLGGESGASLLGGQVTHGLRTCSRAQRQEFERWRLSRNIASGTPYVS